LRSKLPSFEHPPDQCSHGDADCKRRSNRKHGVSLDALSCVSPEFFGSIAALFHRAPHGSDAFLDCIGNRIGRTTSLLGCFSDVFRRSFDYSL
jgi:hypothetical protein